MPFLFTHFTSGRPDGEQVYFSVSRDGLHWRDLNGGRTAPDPGEGRVRHGNGKKRHGGVLTVTGDEYEALLAHRR